MDIAPYIDHTLLKPGTTPGEIEALCAEAVRYGFHAVCIPPYYVALAKSILSNSVKIATVIGFPLGYSTVEAKKVEIQTAIGDGADELDFVINLCALFAEDWDLLGVEIRECLQPILLHDKKIKIIIESGLLSDEQIVKCCRFYAGFKVDFLKTSTGYAAKGADIPTVQLLKKHLPPSILVKASGGIKDASFAAGLIKSGADRIGTSSAVTIIKNNLT